MQLVGFNLVEGELLAPNAVPGFIEEAGHILHQFQRIVVHDSTIAKTRNFRNERSDFIMIEGFFILKTLSLLLGFMPGLAIF